MWRFFCIFEGFEHHVRQPKPTRNGLYRNSMPQPAWYRLVIFAKPFSGTKYTPLREKSSIIRLTVGLSTILRFIVH